MRFNFLMRRDKRKNEELRKVEITPNCLSYAEGSAEISLGNTKVLCSASIEEHLPKWRQNSGKGWITAEYSMLPRSTSSRIRRDRAMSSGRSQEISRLIGRSLRSCCDLSLLGDRQIMIDCDVIQADGGTRVASITGGFVALALAIQKLGLKTSPLKFYVSGVSVAILNDQVIVDPMAQEDQGCSTDMSFSFSSLGDFVEIQGTAENKVFNQDQLNQMIDLGRNASKELFKHQEKIIGSYFPLQ